MSSVRKKYLALYEAALAKGKVGGNSKTLDLEKDLDVGKRNDVKPLLTSPHFLLFLSILACCFFVFIIIIIIVLKVLESIESRIS